MRYKDSQSNHWVLRYVRNKQGEHKQPDDLLLNDRRSN